MATAVPAIKTFETFEHVPGLAPCMKKPITVHAKKMDVEFRVNSLEGNYKQGKPGDYLMRGVDGELYICDGSIFERSYDALPGSCFTWGDPLTSL